MDPSRNAPISHGYTHLSIFDRRSPVIDIVIVALPFVAILFNRLLGPIAPLLVLSTTPLYILLRWERLYGVLKSSWLLLLLPLFALASVFWSDEPARTLRYGFLYFLTVLPAIFIGAGCSREALLKGIFIAFAIYMFMSLPFGRWVSWGGPGGRAFAGLLGSKNASGDIAGLTVLCATTIIFWSVERKHFVWLATAVAVLFCGLFTLWASKATGALVATILAFPCLILWILSRNVKTEVRTAIFMLGILVVVGAVSTMTFWMEPVFEALLESSGKDAGLTGRDVLWQKADQLISERPFLGGGYNAFWVHNNLDAEYLWREMSISTRQGFNFHNTPRDILVDLGFVGLGLFVLVVLYAASRLILRAMLDPSFSGILCCTLLVFESPRIFFELIGFQNIHFGTLIVFVILSYGLRPLHHAEIGGSLKSEY